MRSASRWRSSARPIILVRVNHHSGGQRMREVDRAIAELAAGQHGLVSRAQALALGASTRMIDVRLSTGRWDGVHRGVYRVAGQSATWTGDVMAACLLYGPRAFASHRSAATLPDLGGIQPCPTIELIVPRSHARRRPGIAIYTLAGSLHPADTEIVDGIPATSPARTLFDLAAVLPTSAVEEVLDDALVRRLVTAARLKWQLEKEVVRDAGGYA